MLEPQDNPNPRLVVDRPGRLRVLISRFVLAQLDDPYSHRTAQVLPRLADRAEATRVIDSEAWRPMVEGEPDVAVWSQDRIWFMAARSGLS